MDNNIVQDETRDRGKTLVQGIKRKLPVFILLFLLAAVGLVVTLLLLPDSKENQVLNPFAGLKPGELIVKSDGNRVEEKEFSLSPRDSQETIKQAAALVKKRFDDIRANRITLADKETLISLLPDVRNWQIENPQYFKGGYGGQETANLTASFTSQGSGGVVRVELIDYKAAPSALQPLKMIFKMGRDEETERRSGKVTNYNGNFVLEEYNSKKRERQFSTIIRDRYLVKMKCSRNNSQEILQNFTTLLFAEK